MKQRHLTLHSRLIASHASQVCVLTNSLSKTKHFSGPERGQPLNLSSHLVECFRSDQSNLDRQHNSKSSRTSKELCSSRRLPLALYRIMLSSLRNSNQGSDRQAMSSSAQKLPLDPPRVRIANTQDRYGIINPVDRTWL